MTQPSAQVELNADIDQLLTALENGDTLALQQIYQLWGRQVYSLAFAITHQRETAEEVTQDVFLRVWRKSEQFERGSHFRAWLLGITRNVAIDRLRKDRRPYQEVWLWDDDFLSAEHPMFEDETGWLREALKQLSLEQRQALELAYLGGMTHEQIAAQLDTPLGTIKSRIRDGVIHLRRVWQQENGHDS